MKRLAAIFFSLALSATALGNQISTDSDGNVTLDNGVIVPSHSAMIIEAEGEQFDSSDLFCDIGVLASSGGVFQGAGQARGFCGQFDRFCHTRQFGQNFYEGRFRQRQVFRGRGRDHFSARGAAWGLYLQFLNGQGGRQGGRDGRFQQRFGHQFFFSNNCSGR